MLLHNVSGQKEGLGCEGSRGDRGYATGSAIGMRERPGILFPGVATSGRGAGAGVPCWAAPTTQNGLEIPCLARSTGGWKSDGFSQVPVAVHIVALHRSFALSVNTAATATARMITLAPLITHTDQLPRTGPLLTRQ